MGNPVPVVTPERSQLLSILKEKAKQAYAVDECVELRNIIVEPMSDGHGTGLTP